jgi:putative spermidine/putrescine transport system substrate-binding protein
MKRSHLFAATAALTVTLGVAAHAAGGKLAVVSWGGAYQDAQKIIYFEPAKTAGIDMVDESWDGGVGVLRAKVQGGNAGWDVVQVESDELEIGCEEGLYEKMDFSKIGGAEAYLPEAVHKCGVGAIVYDFVLGYDKDKIPADKAPKSWSDFFDTKTWPGKRALRMGAKTTLEIALMADGVAADKVYETLRTQAGVDRAFKKLDTIKKDLVFWKSGAQPPQFLASGEVVMTSVYNGRIDSANKKDKRNFGIVWNQALYTIDSWVVLKGSPNLAKAYEFLALAGKAENQAKLPNYIAYGVTAKAATPLIDPARLPDLPTAPQNLSTAKMIDVEFWLENNDKLTERFNKWAAQN